MTKESPCRFDLNAIFSSASFPSQRVTYNRDRHDNAFVLLCTLLHINSCPPADRKKKEKSFNHATQ